MENKVDLSRRKFLLSSGAMAIAAVLTANLPAWGDTPIATSPPVTSNDAPPMKPVVLPTSNDPVQMSIADSIFWCDQLQEHAQFFVMLMPGAALAGPRAQAEGFQRTFAGLMNTAKTAKIDRTNLAQFNRNIIEQVKPLVEYKRRMQLLQTSGKLHSLVWPQFFDHTAREAERFSLRLSQYSAGNTALDIDEVRAFWAYIMSDHAKFVAHLLDPKETALFKKSMALAGAADTAQKAKLPKKALELMANEVIDFKTAAELGIQTGQIKSIIHPTLADHVRREAIKFLDEVKRAS